MENEDEGQSLHVRRRLQRSAAVADAVALAAAFGQAARLPRNPLARLMILVEELVTNLVEHGAAAAEDPIDIELALADSAVALRLEDGGLFFDPRGLERGDAPVPERGGGAGIALVRAWARIEDYQREGGRNRLTLMLPVVADAGEP